MRFCPRGLFVLLLASSASAASFDCAKAFTVQEKAICADAKLSKLDEDTAAAYRGLLAQLTPAAVSEVRQDQREWLVWLRRTCPEQNGSGRTIGICLTNKYSARLYQLRNGFQRAGGTTFFPRLKVLTAPNKEERLPGAFYPAFGVGWFSWPEIDRPTPQQKAWNGAVRAQVDLDTADVADSDVTIDYRIRAANDRFLSVDLVNGMYNYGALHPNEVTGSFQWWLELGRALKAADVFAPGSGWEALLGQRSYQKLASGEHAHDLFDETTARRAAADSVRQESNWSLDARKFEVDFPEYSVAPRAAGPLSVEFGWEELRPYLARGFDPAQLPQPLPPPAR